MTVDATPVCCNCLGCLRTTKVLLTCYPAEMSFDAPWHVIIYCRGIQLIGPLAIMLLGVHCAGWAEDIVWWQSCKFCDFSCHDAALKRPQRRSPSMRDCHLLSTSACMFQWSVSVFHGSKTNLVYNIDLRGRCMQLLLARNASWLPVLQVPKCLIQFTLS
jgi:hypothetical protein